MPADADHLHALLQLTLTPGLGPILIRRLLDRFTSPQDALRATPAALQTVEGIGPKRATGISSAIRSSSDAAAQELTLATSLGVSLIAMGSSAYPPLLASLPDAPPILYIRGTLDASTHDQYPVAIVGSRECSAYGLEQSRRFGSILARSGLTVVSGGARGIDTAAHRGALDGPGRTIAVLGCGLAHCYPPENAALYNAIASAGAVVSELPLNTPPTAENFPARNRIISGLSLGVLVIEAGRRSGALITARLAAEEHGRDVMALPGRVDSPTCQGTLDLLKAGGAALVTDPGDVIAALESAAHHNHRGTHTARFPAEAAVHAQPITQPHAQIESSQQHTPMFGMNEANTKSPAAPSAHAQRILAALTNPMTPDELAAATRLEPSQLRIELTMLEIQRRVVRKGTRLERT